MATTAYRIIQNKLLRNAKLSRCARANSFCISKLSTQVQPTECETDDVKINMLQHPDFFQVHKLFTIEDLFNARVHFGHTEGSLDDRMKTFIYGSRLGHLIIDLDQTAELLRQALNFTAHVAYRSGIILFVSRKAEMTHLVEKTAMECGEFSLTRKWKGGIFTNFVHEYKIHTRLPDLCIILSTKNNLGNEHRVVSNAAKMCIPTVGIVDTNCNPNLITYPVPGNDDSKCAIELYCKLFKNAIMIGKEFRDSELSK